MKHCEGQKATRSRDGVHKNIKYIPHTSSSSGSTFVL